jgi:hypothetical protein
MGKQNNKVNPERQWMRFSKEFKLEVVRLLELGQNELSRFFLSGRHALPGRGNRNRASVFGPQR